MVTLEEFLHSGHGYDEVLVVDPEGEELTCWLENDEKYGAFVLHTEEIEEGTCLKITIDYDKTRTGREEVEGREDDR